MQVTGRLYLTLCGLEVNPKGNVNGYCKLEPTSRMPLAVLGLLFNAYNLVARVMIWISKEMHFLLGFFCHELWLLMPVFICVRGVLCLASAPLPALCVPMPTGCLGVCRHVKRFRKFSLSPLAYPVGAEKATKSAKLAERQNPPAQRR